MTAEIAGLSPGSDQPQETDPMGRRHRRADQARPRPLVRRLRAEWERLTSELVAAGTLKRLNPAKRPEFVLRRLRPQGRRARREPHLHLLETRRQTPARPTTGSRPAEMRAKLERPVRRLHARAHDVRRAVLHGPARLEDLPARRRDHRLGLRRHLDAHHDPHGQGRARAAGRGRLLRAGRAHARRAAARPARRTSPGPATRRSGSSTSRRPAKSGATARAMAATRCSARSATRCASPR